MITLPDADMWFFAGPPATVEVPPNLSVLQRAPQLYRISAD
jgi:hypothetical protein